MIGLALIFCGMPYLINLLGCDFASQLSVTESVNSGGDMLEHELFNSIPGAKSHVLFEMSSLIIALIVITVSFIHYRIKRDVIVPILALVLLSTGILSAFYILTLSGGEAIDGSHSRLIILWGELSRVFLALLMFLVVVLSIWLPKYFQIKKRKSIDIKLMLAAGLSCSLMVVAMTFILSSTSLQLLTLKNEVHAGSLESVSLAVLLAGVTFYWFYFAEKLTTPHFTLFLSLLLLITAQFHLIFGSTTLFDNHFNIAYFLKSIAYGTILIGITVDLIQMESICDDADEFSLSTADASAASAKLQAILNSIADAVITINQSGAILAFNQAAEQIFGYQTDEVLGKNVKMLMPNGLASQHDGFLSNYALNGERKIIGLGIELPAIRKGGDIFPMFLTVSEVSTFEGILYTALIRDNTASKLMDAENKRVLSQAKNLAWRLDFALSAPNIGVWEFDLCSGNKVWDSRMYSLYGCLDNQERYAGEVWQSAVSADDRKEIKKTINKAILESSEIHFKHAITLPNKETRHIEAHAKVMLNDKGEKVRLVGTNRDISEQYYMHEIKQQALDMAEESLRLKSEFLASMSHEIRTPMNGVLGMLGLLGQSDLTKQQNHHLQLASSSAQSLLTLINDILDFSKIEAGKLDLEILDFDLRSQLGEFAESMAIRAQDKGLEIILDVSQINCSMVKGDPSRLRQILSNLVGNAIKFTDSGEIVIRAKVTEFNERLRLTCEVIDTGIGIPRNKIASLFDSFTQVDATTTRKYGGTGLGLAIVQQLSQLMGGKVTVESELNKGSTFQFSIDLKQSIQSKIVVPKVDIEGTEILIVDDNDTNLAVLKGQLEIWGANITEAHDGFEAMNFIEQYPVNKFAVAILDMQMPGMDGATLGKAIRENKHSNETKLIMMTSMSQRGDAKFFAGLGFSAYFPKPATTSDLFDALAIVLDDSVTNSTRPLITHHNLQNVDKGIELEPLPKVTRMLLVEDNRINQAVLLGVLANIGLTADVAANGLEALAMLNNSPADSLYKIIIMDCQMPELDGYQTSQCIRKGDAGSHYQEIPIIAMTANAMVGDKEKCLDAGMNDYATKPVEPSILQKKLCHWLGVRKRSSSTVSITKPIETKLTISPSNKVQIDFAVENLVWQRDAFYHRIRNNDTIGRRLIDLFLEDTPLLKNSMDEAIENNSIEELLAAAHKLKGSTKNLGGERLAQTIEDIEFVVKEDKLNELIPLKIQLQQDFDELCDALANVDFDDCSSLPK